MVYFLALCLNRVEHSRHGPGEGSAFRGFAKKQTQVSAFHSAQIKGQATQERDSLNGGGSQAAALAEQVDLTAAVGADEATHVFQKPQDRQVGVAAKIDGFTHVRQGHFLGRADNNSPGVGNLPGHAHRFIARSRRGIDDQEIPAAPFYIAQKLADGLVLHRHTLDDRSIPVGEKPFDGDHF